MRSISIGAPHFFYYAIHIHLLILISSDVVQLKPESLRLLVRLQSAVHSLVHIRVVYNTRCEITKIHLYHDNNSNN